MRIIAGHWKGFHLDGGRFKDVRPLTDRIKESLFGILGDQIEEAIILDLFAGSGSFGLEALSRDAKQVVFCEKSSEVADLIRKNLKKTKCDSSRYQIITADVFKILPRLSTGDIFFDILFADPPFRIPQSEKFLHSLSKFDVLSRKGILIYRHHKKEMVPQQSEHFHVYREKVFGDSVVKFYRKEEDG